MTHVYLRCEFDSGDNLEFVPKFVYPLSSAELRKLQKDGKAALELQLEADAPIINGVRKDGRARVKATVTFDEPPIIYALVKGGWLPLPFAIPPHFLVDRNVVISLRKLRLGRVVSTGAALAWWTRFFEQGSTLFNPLPYAFESGYRRKPTVDEFVAAYHEGVNELRESFPTCDIVRLQDVHYRAAYAQLEAFDQRYERESAFLMKTSSFIAERVPRQREREVLDLILQVADDLDIPRGSLISLAVLSCLFEHLRGEIPSIGRLIVKPKKAYTIEDSFNAISDLRHIELAAAAQTYFSEHPFALCTCDRAIALFWSALALRGESPTGGAITVTFDLSTDLFSRLSDDEILKLRDQLTA